MSKRLNNFRDLTEHLSHLNHRIKVAVVHATDKETQNAVFRAVELGFAEALFVGGMSEVKANPQWHKLSDFCQCIEAADAKDAAEKAVELIRTNKAEVLMKGLLNTDVFLRAVLNKEKGILPAHQILTHISCAEIPTYPRLLFFSDAAVIPYPTQQQRTAQIRYIVSLCHSLGIATPRVAMIHCSEQINEKLFPFTLGYRDLIMQAEQGEFGACILDGPLDVKTSCNKEALDHKGISSPIDGAADALIFPDIESGNTFYKSITLFGQAEMACVLQGASVPVILTSRSDSELSKYNSLALAIGSLVNKK